MPEDQRTQDELRWAELEARLDNAIAEILSAADFPEIFNKLKSHEKVIHGNGRPGLVETVATLTPLVKRMDDHLVNFSKFEIETKVDRQSVHDSIESMKKDLAYLTGNLESGFAKITEEMKPFKALADNFTKVFVATAFLAALGGGLIVGLAWLAEHFDMIRAWFKHG